MLAQLVRASACHAEGYGFEFRASRHFLVIGRVFHRLDGFIDIEEVAGSIPATPTSFIKMLTFKRIVPRNVNMAIEIAREIFPYEVHNGEFWPRTAYKKSIQEQNPDFMYYLVRDKNVIVGITGHYREKNKKFGLGWFGVVPSLRRKGYGQLILEQTISIISSFGADQIDLYSGDREEEFAAHKLYLKNGFKKLGKGIVDGSPVLYFRRKI